MRADLIPIASSWLLTYLLHSTLLLGGVWLVTRRVITTPGLRDLLWKAALVGGFATATVQIGLGFEPLGGAVSLRLGRSATEQPRPGADKHPEGDATSLSSVDAWNGLLAESRAVTPGKESLSGHAAPVAGTSAESAVATSRSLASAPPTAENRSWTWLLPAGMLAWALVGCGLSGLYLIQRARAIRRIGPRRQVSDIALLDMLDGLRHAGRVDRIIRLTAARGLGSPVALGHDEIALPEAALTDLDQEQQRSMLAHELAHLERRDPAWLALGCLIERGFFLQPLNRLARVRMQEAAEYLCDDWAVHRTGSGVSLATCLVKVAEWVQTPRPIPFSGMAEHRSQLVTRIHRLIEGRPMPASSRSTWLMAGAVALIGVTAVVAPGFTTGGTDLVAQGAVPTPQPAAPDSNDAWVRRLAREASLARSRAHLDASRARLEVLREMRAARVAPVAVPRTPMPPMPPMAPVLAELKRLQGVRAAWSVGRDGEQRRRDTTSIAVPALMIALKDQDVQVRRAAAKALANLQDIRAVPVLIEATRDGDAEVRASAIGALGQIGDKRATPALVAALKDPVKDVKHAALDALHEMPGDVPDEAILAALSDADAEIRQSAMSLAENRMSEHSDDEGYVADPRYVAAFTHLLGDADADVRSQAASALGEAGLKEAPAALLAAGKDKSADVRQNVASALGRIRDAKSVGTLKEMLQDSNADVREQAVQALSEIRDRASLEALVTALKSSDPVVRRQAAEALGQRDGE